MARCEGLTQKGSFGLGVLSAVQQLLFVWGQSLCQSLFLISALQGGDSASDAKLWRIWSFCGEGCSETSVSVPCFLSCWYISSTDLAKGPCPSKTKNRWERTWWSEITVGLGFFPLCFDFPGGSSVGIQYRDTELYSVLLWKWRLFLLPCASSSPCAGRSCKLVLALRSRVKLGEVPDVTCSLLPGVALNNLCWPLDCVLWVSWFTGCIRADRKSVV